MRFAPSHILLSAATLLCALPCLAQSTPGCTLANNTYTCDNVTFQQALRRARTVSLETNRIDRFARTQLEALAAKLGKTVVTDSPGDLILVLRPTDRDGVNIINGEVELSTLRIYSGAAEGDRTLLWSESYRQRPDTPWPSAVHGVIAQFEHHFPTH